MSRNPLWLKLQAQRRRQRRVASRRAPPLPRKDAIRSYHLRASSVSEEEIAKEKIFMERGGDPRMEVELKIEAMRTNKEVGRVNKIRCDTFALNGKVFTIWFVWAAAEYRFVRQCGDEWRRSVKYSSRDQAFAQYPDDIIWLPGSIPPLT